MLRALGFTAGLTRRLFLRETALLSGVSLSAGCVLGAVAILVINAAGIRIFPPGIAGGIQLILVPDLLASVATAVALVALACGASWVSVRKASNKSIALALTRANR